MSPQGSPTCRTPRRSNLLAGQATSITASCSTARDAAGASVATRLRNVALLASVALIGLIPCVSHAQTPGPALTKQLMEQVVLIKFETGLGSGSGVILDVDRVVTNCHVADVATVRDTNLQVITEAGAAPLAASQIARDPAHDLCLLAIDGPTLLRETDITQIADSPVQAGDPVYAAGAPGGYIDRVTGGMVSARRDQRHFPVNTQAWMATKFELCSKDELDAAWYIETDAQFSGGSSGGGLFNANGELVGITTFLHALPNDPDPRFAIRFAIPAAHVRTLVAEKPDDALRDVVKHFAKARKFQRALTTSGRIGSTNQRVHALLDIAKAELSDGRTPGAVSTLMTAVTAARTIEDTERRAKRLEEVAEHLAEAGEFGRASRIAASIDLLEHQARAYEAVAKEQAEKGFFADARRTVRQIRDAPIRAQTNDGVTRKQIRAWIDEDNLARARQAANEIQSPFKRVSALRRIARAYGRLHDVPAARRTYGEAIRLANEIGDFSERAQALIDIAEDLAGENYPTDPRTTVDAAVRAAAQIPEGATRDETFDYIVRALSGMPDFASTLFLVAGRIGDSRARDSATRGIVDTLADRGQFDAARERAQTIVNLSIRGGAQRRIVRRLLHRRAWARALALASEIADDPSRAEALLDIVEARADSEEIYAAMRVADLIEDTITRTAAYVHITNAALDAPGVDRELVDELLETTEGLARTIDDPGERAGQLSDLAAVYVNARKDPQAERIVVALVSTRHYARGLWHLSDAYADRGDFDKALTRIRRIPHCAERERERATKHLARKLKHATR